MPSLFATPPPQSSIYLLSYPAPGVLLVTINRARHMNAIHYQGHWDFHALWTWFDDEHTLQVGIVTGAGDKAFCAGQDLLEIEIERNNTKIPPAQQRPPATLRVHPPSGFAGLSQRKGKKPVIAAVNGFAFGGGFEICLNWLVKRKNPPFVFVGWMFFFYIFRGSPLVFFFFLQILYINCLSD
ncbi:enoyl-CoA hydratase [Histoplasma ohiense]|nr:enoyl-CoA hydratase [Histoplasma ohiense (nom. inval.)]